MNTTLNMGDVVDKLGRVKAQIADLTETEKDLKSDLIASCEKVIDGSLFRATISSSVRNQTDYKGIVADLMATGRISMKTYNEIVEKRTTQGDEVFTVRVVARTAK